MAESVLFKPTSVVSRNDRLLIALFMAIIFHALLLIINFKSPKPKRVNKDLEITLVTKVTPKPPKLAHHIAPEHQIGGGQKKIKATPPKLTIPSTAQTEKKAQAPSPEPLKPQTLPKVITQKVAKKPIAAPKQLDEAAPIHQPQPQQPQPQLSLEALRMQIAELGDKIVKHEEQSQENNRIKFTNGVSSYKHLAAQYKSDFIQKIERIGSRNFPEAAMKNIAVAHVGIDVGIKADGSIYSIHIHKKSGYPALDEAAKKIVRMSAPFPRLPKALLNELDILVISREWEFSDNSRMSAN